MFNPTDEQIAEAALYYAAEKIREEAQAGRGTEKPVSCRRCSECIGQDHHWIEEETYATYDAEDDPLDAELIGDHVCKHCPVVGMTCDECDGEGGFGEIDEDDGEHEFDCPECIGRGIVVVHDIAADDEPDEDASVVVENQAAS